MFLRNSDKDIGRKTDFLRHEMAQNRLNTIELRERARDLKYRIGKICSISEIHLSEYIHAARFVFIFNPSCARSFNTFCFGGAIKLRKFSFF